MPLRRGRCDPERGVDRRSDAAAGALRARAAERTIVASPCRRRRAAASRSSRRHLLVAIAASLLSPELAGVLLRQSWIACCGRCRHRDRRRVSMTSGTIDVLPRLVVAVSHRHVVVAALPAEIRSYHACRYGSSDCVARCSRRLVRQPRQLHGRHRLDDSRGSRCHHAAISVIALMDALAACVVLVVALSLLGAIDRIRAVQPAGRATFSRRRRKPADRTLAVLAAAATCGERTSHRGATAAALLSRRRDRHAAAPCSNGEQITQAHRTHFYQRATERGMSVPEVLVRVALVNIALVVLAILSVWLNSTAD